MRQIAIYGAFDRFNYGDLLFPLILERTLEPLTPMYRLDYYGVIQSDLSSYGGRPTKPMETLFDTDTLEDGSIVIVAGGEVLGATWFDIYSCLLPESLSSFQEAATTYVPRPLLHAIRPCLPGASLELPFVVGPEDFGAEVRVVYNSVGGTALARPDFPPRLASAVRRRLQCATFVSVRDQVSMRAMNGLFRTGIARLAPDSATLVSRYFPKDTVTDRLQPRIAQQLDRLRNGYMALQIARRLVPDLDDAHRLAGEIEAIYQDYGIPVVLCPIGTALGHQDHVALRMVYQLLTTPAILIEAPTIFDIMAVIANSRLFVGTSLHGAITAMSFAVPNLALTHRVPKLDAYLDTWALPILRQSVSVGELSSAVRPAISVAAAELERKRGELIEASLESFGQMVRVLGGAETSHPMRPERARKCGAASEAAWPDGDERESERHELDEALVAASEDAALWRQRYRELETYTRRLMDEQTSVRFLTARLLKEIGSRLVPRKLRHWVSRHITANNEQS